MGNKLGDLVWTKVLRKAIEVLGSCEATPPADCAGACFRVEGMPFGDPGFPEVCASL